jgi:hypothetical protein
MVTFFLFICAVPKPRTFSGAFAEMDTSRRRENSPVFPPGAAKDFGVLVRLGVDEKVGLDRSTRYRAAIVK